MPLFSFGRQRQINREALGRKLRSQRQALIWVKKVKAQKSFTVAPATVSQFVSELHNS